MAVQKCSYGQLGPDLNPLSGRKEHPLRKQGFFIYDDHWGLRARKARGVANPRNSSVHEAHRAIAAELLRGGVLRKAFVSDRLVDGRAIVHHPRFEVVEADECPRGGIPVADGEYLVRRG